MPGVGAVTPAVLPAGTAAGQNLLRNSSDVGFGWGVTASSSGYSQLFVSGRWYSNLLGPNPIGGAGGFGTNLTKAVRYIPIYLGVPVTISALGIVATGSTNSGTVRLGVYKSDSTTGYPTTVLISGSTFSVSTSSGTAAFTSTAAGTIPAGLSFIAVGCDAAPGPAINGAGGTGSGQSRRVPLYRGPSGTLPPIINAGGAGSYVDAVSAWSGTFVTASSVTTSTSNVAAFFKVA